MAFNSQEYAFREISVFMAGRLITGFTAVKYETSRTVTDIYASGDKPHSRTKGNKVYTGEITLLQSELNALEDASGSLGLEDITDLDFNITILYGKNPIGIIRTDQLIDCTVNKWEKGMAQDDPNMEISLPIMIGEIKTNV